MNLHNIKNFKSGWKNFHIILSCIFIFLYAKDICFQESKRTREVYIQLPEIIIQSAILRKERNLNIPYSVDVIEKENIEFSGSRNTPTSLNFQSNVTIQETAFGHGSPFIRGLTGFRNVYLIDGIRLNNSSWRDGPVQYLNTIDSYLISKIEIIKGPSSVLYGSDAMGGVVAITTKEPLYKKGVSSYSSMYFSSASDSFLARQEVHIRETKYSFYIGATFKHFNDVRGGKNTGRQPMTGFSENNNDWKFIYKLSNNTHFTVAYQRTFQNDVPRTHRTIYAIPFRDTTIGTDKKSDFDQWRDLFYIQYHQEDEGKFFKELHASISYHRQKETYLRILKNNKQEYRWKNIETIGNWLYFNSDTKVGKLIYGYDIYYDILNSRGFDRAASGEITYFARGEIPDDSQYFAMGIFFQDEYDITERIKSISGIRVQYIYTSADKINPDPKGSDPNLMPLKKSWASIIPSQRFSYLVSENLNLILGISGGFRAPNLEDLASVRLIFADQTQIPNTALSPEKSWNFEIGLKYTSKRVYISGFYFYNLLQDLIRWVNQINPPNTIKKENFANGFIQGIEIDVEYNIYKNLYIYGNLGYIDSGSDAIDAKGNRIRAHLDFITTTTLNLGIEYKTKRFINAFYVKAVAGKNPSQYSPAERTDTQRIPPSGLPGYTIFNLSFQYKIKENIVTSLTLENLFNIDYRGVACGLNGTGFNAVLRLDITF